jgi:hypothetical protein
MQAMQQINEQLEMQFTKEFEAHKRTITLKTITKIELMETNLRETFEYWSLQYKFDNNILLRLKQSLMMNSIGGLPMLTD